MTRPSGNLRALGIALAVIAYWFVGFITLTILGAYIAAWTTWPIGIAAIVLTGIPYLWGFIKIMDRVT